MYLGLTHALYDARRARAFLIYETGNGESESPFGDSARYYFRYSDLNTGEPMLIIDVVRNFVFFVFPLLIINYAQLLQGDFSGFNIGNGEKLSYSLVALHFRCSILRSHPVHGTYRIKKLWVKVALIDAISIKLLKYPYTGYI